MGSDGVTGGANMAHHLRMRAGLAADHEERGAETFVGQRLEHVIGVGRLGPVVEGQHHLARCERQRHAVVVAADQRHGARIDLHHAAHAERVRVGAWRSARDGTAERDGARDHGQRTQTTSHCGEIDDARRSGGVTARNLAAQCRSRRETGIHHEGVSLTRVALTPTQSPAQAETSFGAPCVRRGRRWRALWP